MEINDVLNSDSPRTNGSKIDALTVVYTGISPETLTEFIGKEIKWEQRDYGRYGYRKSYAFGNIIVLFDGKSKDMGVCLELLGQGCDEMRLLTKSDSIFFDLLKFEKADKVRLTRIDIAADDYTGLLDMEVIQQKVDRNEIWTNLQDKTVNKGLDKTPGHTVYIGSAKSNSRIRIYDKGAQMKTTYPWVRVELVLRKENAEAFRKICLEKIDYLAENKSQEIARLGIGVLYGRLSFFDKLICENGDIRIRECNWWTEFLNTAPVELNVAPKVPPSIQQACKWLLKQVFPTLVLLMALLGPDWFDSMIEQSWEMIDLRRAAKWTAEMEAVGMPPFLSPDDPQLLMNLRKALKDHYNTML